MPGVFTPTSLLCRWTTSSAVLPFRLNGHWRRSAGIAMGNAGVEPLSSSPLESPMHCRATHTSRRFIIVPRQLSAYGDTFSQSVGERSDHLAGHLVLQSLSPSRIRQSPLLAKPVKTKAVDSFVEMLVDSRLQQALADMRITTPSPIQQTAIEVVLQGKHTLIAAPHGEGKTLAYLLPLYQNMLKDRDVYHIPLRERRPRMLLLAPTRELVEQLQGVCAKLDAATGLRSCSFTSRKRAKYHLSRMLKDNMADVLIMDPKIILRLIRARRLFIDDLRYVAVDEADAMLSSLHDHDAVHLLMKIEKRVQYKHLWPVQTQIVFSTPYLTRKIEYLIGKRFPHTVTCMQRKHMHKPPLTLKHRFFSVRQEGEKLTVLLHLLRKHGHVPCVVDTDEVEIRTHTEPHVLKWSLSEYREYYYQTHGQLLPATEGVAGSDHQGKDRRINEESRATSTLLPMRPVSSSRPVNAGEATSPPYEDDPILRHSLEQIRPLHWMHLTTVAAPFTCPTMRTVFAPGKRTVIFFHGIDAATALFHQLQGAGHAVSLLHASLPWAVRRDMYHRFASGVTNILCATDVMARGVDVHVDVVVNFDMPTNALTYLSRAGRTARMGRLGSVYSLYTKRQGVIVSAVRAFLRKNLPLEGLSNYKMHMTKPRYAEWRTHKINALSRAYVSLITRKTIPAHLERTYIHHNATWRPIFHPQTTGRHGGVAPRQQQKVMERVMEQAVWYRRGQLARRKGGRAKFGRRDMRSGVWNDIGGVTMKGATSVQQDSNPGGPHFGPPSGPPE